MAKRGAQVGNNNATKGKPWREALDKAIKQYEDKDNGIKRGQALFRIATNVVIGAIEGNKDAIQEIGNRLDGKAHQSMDIGVYESKPLEDMSNAELAGELAAVREVISRNTEKKRSKEQSSQVH